MKRKLKITIKDDHNHYALIEQVNNRETEINRGIFLDKDQYEQLRQHFVSGSCFSNQSKMNKVYESPTMVVHDDREPLTIEQAFELLWDGKLIRVNDPPDFSAENESDIYGREFIIDITDILSRDVLESQSKEKSEKEIHEFLRGYEIYR